MDTEINVASLGMTFLNNTRNVNDLDFTLNDIKKNVSEASKNLSIILKDLDLDNDTKVESLKQQIVDLSNTFHNNLGY